LVAYRISYLLASGAAWLLLLSGYSTAGRAGGWLERALSPTMMKNRPDPNLLGMILHCYVFNIK